MRGGAAAARANRRQRGSRATQIGLGYLPLHIMRHDRLWEMHASKLGRSITVSYTTLGGGAALNDALISGSVHVVAGGSLVLVEAAELVIDGKPNREMLEQLRAALDMARVMFELPGPWIADVRSCDIESLKKLLVEELGPDVTLANVTHDTVIDLEATRTSLGTAGPGFVLDDLAAATCSFRNAPEHEFGPLRFG